MANGNEPKRQNKTTKRKKNRKRKQTERKATTTTIITESTRQILYIMKISYNILKYIFLYRYNRRSGEINASFGTTKVAAAKSENSEKCRQAARQLSAATLSTSSNATCEWIHHIQQRDRETARERERMNHSTVARPINSRRMGTCSSIELEKERERETDVEQEMERGSPTICGRDIYATI